MPRPPLSRREFLDTAVLGCAALAVSHGSVARATGLPSSPQTTSPSHASSALQQLDYGDVTLNSPLHENQLANCREVLLQLNNDSLMKPFREMAGLPAPGAELGGWYMYKADYDYRKDSAGLAPGATFGQWVSALARMHAISGDAAIREKVLELNRLYAQSISAGFFEKNRFPAYSYDKLVCGLIDAHQFAHDPTAFETLAKTTDIAQPHLPPHAIDREQNWRAGKDVSYSWDESYTLPENLFLAYRRGAGERYRSLASRYLDDETYFDPLAAGKNVMAGKHAYSYVNALSSAMQAYLTLDSGKHLRAAKNGFEMLLTTQSFATGGWGPDEMLRAPGSEDLYTSLTKTHSSFETPCGSYAHFKLSRYLLLVTGDSRYGDSMECVMYNTVLGAKPLQPDGEAFYYSDYNFQGSKKYSSNRWPCCSGTLPQVAADYRINTYFRDSEGICVNLYVPSTVRWKVDATPVELTQTGDYPFDPRVKFQIKTAAPVAFPLKLRIPAWAESATVSVNREPLAAKITPGSFAAIQRRWSTGDELDLEFSTAPRLAPIDARHADVVALMIGPLVFFPLVGGPLTMSRKQLLAVKRTAVREWRAGGPSASVALLPFVAIADEPYSTYVRVT